MSEEFERAVAGEPPFLIFRNDHAEVLVHERALLGVVVHYVGQQFAGYDESGDQVMEPVEKWRVRIETAPGVPAPWAKLEFESKDAALKVRDHIMKAWRDAVRRREGVVA